MFGNSYLVAFLLFEVPSFCSFLMCCTSFDICCYSVSLEDQRIDRSFLYCEISLESDPLYFDDVCNWPVSVRSIPFHYCYWKRQITWHTHLQPNFTYMHLTYMFLCIYTNDFFVFFSAFIFWGAFFLLLLHVLYIVWHSSNCTLMQMQIIGIQSTAFV